MWVHRVTVAVQLVFGIMNLFLFRTGLTTTVVIPFVLTLPLTCEAVTLVILGLANFWLWKGQSIGMWQILGVNGLKDRPQGTPPVATVTAKPACLRQLRLMIIIVACPAQVCVTPMVPLTVLVLESNKVECPGRLLGASLPRAWYMLMHFRQGAITK